MNRPDLLITWHESCDYPLARHYLHKYQDYFGKIIIYFSKHHREHVYASFLKENLKDLKNVIFLDPIEYKYGEEDWRNISTNYMLKHSDSEWVCSIEQDWFDKDWIRTLNLVTKTMETADLIGWMQPAMNYIHPGFWFIKRELLEKTKKDFSAHDNLDHFGWITKDAQKLGAKIVSLQDLGLETNLSPEADCFHVGGVNQNVLNGFDKGYEFHRGEIFYVYNYWSKKIESPMASIIKDLNEILRLKYPEINPEESEWAKFFKI